MPRRKDAHTPLEKLSVAERQAEPIRCQEHWYHLISRIAGGVDVLDVGAGVPYGLELLRVAQPQRLVGIDPLPVSDSVHNLSVEQLRTDTFDLVVSMDVIEHVDDDLGFLGHLLRVARYGVFISTPNFDHWGCKNPYHVREYTSKELRTLVGGRPALYFNVGADRIASPPRAAIKPLKDAASFGVLLKADFCPAEVWQTYNRRLAFEGLGAWILNRLDRRGIYSEEWISKVKNIKPGADGLPTAVARWVSRQIVTDQDDPLPPLERNDIVDALRHGRMTERQQAMTLAWAWNTSGVCKNASTVRCKSKLTNVSSWLVKDEQGNHYTFDGEWLFQLG